MNRIIYLLRHTSVDVQDGICYGQTDVKVSNTYQSELLVIKEKLRDIVFDSVYSSPLTRCLQLAKEFEKEVILDNDLKEMNFGKWEKKSWDYIFSTQEGKEWFQNYLICNCPNGESFKELQYRAGRFVKSQIDNNLGASLIVTHAGIIRAILANMNFIDVEKVFDQPIAYGNIIKIVNGEWQLL